MVLHLRLERIRLTKRFPLAISRGVSTGSENVFVSISDGQHTGLGECAPGVGNDDTLAEKATADLETFWPRVEALCAKGIAVRAVHALAEREGLEPPVLAGLDTALWDLLAKRAGLPLYALLGYDKPTVPTSITVGINPPEVTRERVPLILRETGCRHLKVKLGSKQGLDHDRAHFTAALEASRPFGATLRVDANGGWSLAAALEIIPWLKERGVDYVEQPLEQHALDDLAVLHGKGLLPIYVDESCQTAGDIPRVAGRSDGVNLKLMKCGGVTGALRIIEAAETHGLGLMIGCMGESSVSISAGAALGAAMTHIDLDSHLNLAPDPADGARLENGVVMPLDVPGHGASLRPR
jgi:L-alanine-DL-glutamate epimerase-like enolase superfamily enzyme